MRKASKWFIMLSLLLAFGGIGAFAQANSELTGIVTDQTGAVVAGAHLRSPTLPPDITKAPSAAQRACMISTV